MCLQWKCERVTDSTDLYNGTERVTFSIKTDLERIGPLHDPLRWYKITHAGLGRNLHSGTSKTKQLVPVRLDLPLFWKSHYATCVSARVILYQTLSLVESYSLWGYRWRDLQLDVKQLWKNLRKCRYFPINRNHVCEMSTGTLPTSSPASGRKMRPSVMGPFSYGPLQLWAATSSRNKPIPSCLCSLFQNESSCKNFRMKMSLICMKMNL